DQARVFKEPRLRPGEPTSSVDQQAIECVADAAAQRRGKIELFGHGAGRGRARRDDTIIEKIWERDISFNSEKQPRRQQIIVSELQAAKEATEGGTGSNRVWIEQCVAPGTSAVSDVT